MENYNAELTLPNHLISEFSSDEIEDLQEQVSAQICMLTDMSNKSMQFVYVDTSGDGQLDADELYVVMQRLDVPVQKEKVYYITEILNDLS